MIKNHKGGNHKMKSHGLSKTPVWYAWKGMRDRCKYKANVYHHGKGITVCERWNDFINFYEDMGLPPTGYVLDRIDGNGNYEPGNCRWTTYEVNNNNASHNKHITFNNETHTQAEWARKVGLSPKVLKQRLHKGWSIERALTQEARRDAK